MNKVSDDISKDLKDQPKFTTDIGEKDQDHHSFDLGEQTTLKKIILKKIIKFYLEKGLVNNTIK